MLSFRRVRTRRRCRSKLDVAPDVSKSFSREVYCLSVCDRLPIVLTEVVVVGEDIQSVREEEDVEERERWGFVVRLPCLL